MAVGAIQRKRVKELKLLKTKLSLEVFTRKLTKEEAVL